jgi:hypothetical protein
MPTSTPNHIFPSGPSCCQAGSTLGLIQGGTEGSGPLGAANRGGGEYPGGGVAPGTVESNGPGWPGTGTSGYKGDPAGAGDSPGLPSRGDTGAGWPPAPGPKSGGPKPGAWWGVTSTSINKIQPAKTMGGPDHLLPGPTPSALYPGRKEIPMPYPPRQDHRAISHNLSQPNSLGSAGQHRRLPHIPLRHLA